LRRRWSIYAGDQRYGVDIVGDADAATPLICLDFTRLAKVDHATVKVNLRSSDRMAALRLPV
jgi:hypothetical protein